MNSAKNLLANKACALILATAGFFVGGYSARAQNVQHLTITQPGGMPGLPVMTGIEKTTNGVSVTWDGPSGYYQVLRKWGLVGGNWQPVGGPNLTRKATITEITSNAFFRVSGPSPQYAGAQSCIECHENIHTTEMDTRHASALETLKQVFQDKNPSCLPCHTVGYGLPSGFVSEAATPQLAGVQCENCHGPAGNHAANEFDLTVRPRVEIAATVCGGCHTGSHHPTFDEWKTSGHAEVTEPDMNPNSCGRCHIGPARIAMLKGKPVPQNDNNVGVVCVICHDPHAKHVFANALNGVLTNVVNGRTIVITNNQLGALYTNQLRNPLSSTNDYFLTTSDVFTNKYNANINACAQCHNHRGAAWNSSGRAPHHSPQYNILIGTVGELDTGLPPNQPATHAFLEKQCAGCHMQTEEFQSEEQPAVTGHKFEVDNYETCARCHQDAANARLLAAARMANTSNLVQVIKEFYLDAWAVNYAPDSLRTKYGTRAWEYTIPGDFYSGTSGPNAAEQALIPDNIKKARFDLYLVLYDGSYGVHNPGYSLNLLMNAANWVQLEINK